MKQVVTGAVVIGLVAGIYLGGFFKGFGLGGGAGTGPGNGAASTAKKSSDKPAPADAEPDDGGDFDSSANYRDPAQCVEVLIEERDFQVRSKSGKLERKTLDEVLALARVATGTEDGLRVKVFRSGTARASAETALKDGLTEAGIDDLAIQWLPSGLQ